MPKDSYESNQVPAKRETPTPLRGDAQERHDRLCQMIVSLTQTEGFELDGYTWAPSLSQKEWAGRANISIRTLRNMIKLSPIVAKTRGHGKNKATLLRVGEPDPNAEQEAEQRHVANILSKIFRKHMAERERSEVRANYTELALVVRSARSQKRLVGRQRIELQEIDREWKITPPSLYGYLNGLVENWPDGWEARVFYYTLNHWPKFMDTVKFESGLAWELRQAGHVPQQVGWYDPEYTAYVLRDVDLSKYRRAGKRVRRNGKIVRKNGLGLGDGYNWWTWRKPHLPFLLRFSHVARAMYVEKHKKNWHTENE